MKKFFVICLLLAASLCLTQEAKAQYAGPITRQDANLVDQSGHILTDSEIIGLVGNDIFEETVVGARRQLQAGKSLIIGGAAGIGTGLVFAVFSGVEMAKSRDNAARNNRSHSYNYGPGAGLFLLSTAFTSLGTLALGGGVAFRSIGKSRLGWVANQCNPASGSVTLEWSATPAGAGIVMRF